MFGGVWAYFRAGGINFTRCLSNQRDQQKHQRSYARRQTHPDGYDLFRSTLPGSSLSLLVSLSPEARSRQDQTDKIWTLAHPPRLKNDLARNTILPGYHTGLLGRARFPSWLYWRCVVTERGAACQVSTMNSGLQEQACVSREMRGGFGCNAIR